jgi:hypothetical protein
MTIVERWRRWKNADGPGPDDGQTMGALAMRSPVWTAADHRFAGELQRRLGSNYLGFTGQGYANRFGGGFVSRPAGRVPTTYVLHHTAGSQRDTGAELWRFHVQSRGWDTDGYHIVVRVDGRVELVIPPSMMSYGAGVHNPYTIHVSVPGNYVSQTPAPAMLASVYQVFLALDVCYGGHPWRGHSQLMSTACPAQLLPHLVRMRGPQYGAASPPKPSYP